MEYEISPEPTPEEREALTRALELLADQAAPESAWWRAGVSESAESG